MSNLNKDKNILDNIDKKLVNDGKLLFNRLNENKSFSLTNDGMIEIYDNDKYKDKIPFSKLGIVRESKLLLQEGYQLMEFVDNNTATPTSDELEQMKSNLQQDVQNVEEIQDLKDELEDKLSNLEESNDYVEDYALVLYKNINGNYEPDVTISNISDNDIEIANNIEETKFFDKELADYYAETYNKNITNNNEYLMKVVQASDLDSLDSLYKSNINENLSDENFPSTDFTKNKLTASDMKNIDLIDNLTVEQVAWIQTHIGNLDLVSFGLKDLANKFENDSKIISLDDYIRILKENIHKFEN